MITSEAPRGVDPIVSASKTATLKLLRAIFLILLVVFTALLIVTDSTLAEGGFQLVRWWPLAVVGTLLFFIGVLALDILTPKRKLATVSAIFVGLITGVIVAAILGMVVDLFSDIYEIEGAKLIEPFKILLGLGICYLTISTVLQTQDDFRLVIPYVEFAKKIRGARPLILDTSVLVDGRVIAVAETGVFQSPLIVPRFVIDELQRLSDSSDRLKRARGRRGLEIVSRLQRSAPTEVRLEDAPSTSAGVDQQLVELAQSLPGTLVTTDSGLARVATISGVVVINLNELAAALKASLHAGESIEIMILRRGEQPGQGVGYLEDGTMVVVEDGAEFMGTEQSVTVSGSTQTSAGRLIFARVQPIESGRPRAEEPAPSASAASAEEASPLAAAPRVIEPPAVDRARESSPRGPFGPGRIDGGSRSPRNPRR